MQQGKADTADKPNKIDEADVLEKLSTVQDPHLRRDIVSLGFVKNIKICSPIISFDIERSSPTSLVRERLKTEAEVAVKGLAESKRSMFRSPRLSKLASTERPVRLVRTARRLSYRRSRA